MTLLRMTSLTEPHPPEAPGRMPVSIEGGDLPGRGIAVLDLPVEWMRFCGHCDSEQRFVAGWICDAGLVGCCAVCGAESVAPFTRMNSEVA